MHSLNHFLRIQLTLRWVIHRVGQGVGVLGVLGVWILAVLDGWAIGDKGASCMKHEVRIRS